MKIISKQNKAIQRYFENISVIPEEIRNLYLKKILSRKNASSQKNVALIKSIFFYLKKDKINYWDDNKICKKLDINKNTYYWHRSNILKELRKFYFGWKEIEKKEFELNPDSLQNRNKKDLQFLKIQEYHAKAIRMFEIGMRLEAKNLLLNIEKRIYNFKPSDKNLRLERIYLLSSIYYLIIKYYHGCRNSLRFNLYRAKLEKLFKYNKSKFTYQEFLIVEIRQLISLALKSTFRVLGNDDYEIAIDYLIKAFEKAKLINDVQTLFYIALFIEDASMRLNYKSTLIRDYLLLCHKIAIKNKNVIAILTFKAALTYYEYIQAKSDNKEINLNVIRDCYTLAKEYSEHNPFLIVIERILIRISADLSSKEDFLKLLVSSYNSNMLESTVFEAKWRLYAYHSLSIDNNSYTWKFIVSPFSKTRIPVINKINQEALAKLNVLAENALEEYKRIFSFQIYSNILTELVSTEFFKAENYERALLFIKKRERLEKTKTTPGYVKISIYKLGISIIEDSHFHNEEYLINKYQKTFIDLMNYFYASTSGVNLLDRYAIVIHIAQTTNLKFMWKIAEDFYAKLEKMIPDILESEFSKL
jgi:hypothetical protein